MEPLKILIAAGGTGGHIYPALAMAEAFLRKRPDTQIGFVGTAAGLENKIVPPNGFPVHHLSIGRLNGVSLGERLKTIFSLPWSFVQSWYLLKKTKPDFVLGVGGHASGPLLLVASLFRYRTAIWEPNAMPGLANRWLSSFVDECWVVFEEAKASLKNKNLNQAGMPVRREIEGLFENGASTSAIQSSMSSSASATAGRPFHVLVFGGSQGARGINNAVLEMITTHPEWLKEVQVVHQTGPADFQRISEGYKKAAIDQARLEVKEYLHDMGNRYQWADLIICRSGTGTLSELAACAKPAILIPFPFASDDHQKKNAESLANKGAALMIQQKDLTVNSLFAAIEKLRGNPGSLQAMAESIRSFHHPQAAERLVEKFVERIEQHAPR